jgi:hypothetical protein
LPISYERAGCASHPDKVIVESSTLSRRT